MKFVLFSSVHIELLILLLKRLIFILFYFILWFRALAFPICSSGSGVCVNSAWLLLVFGSFLDSELQVSFSSALLPNTSLSPDHLHSQPSNPWKQGSIKCSFRVVAQLEQLLSTFPFAPTSLAPLQHYPIVPGALPSAALIPRMSLLETKKAFFFFFCLACFVCGMLWKEASGIGGWGKRSDFCAFPEWIWLGMFHLWHLGWIQGFLEKHHHHQWNAYSFPHHAIFSSNPSNSLIAMNIPINPTKQIHVRAAQRFAKLSSPQLFLWQKQSAAVPLKIPLEKNICVCWIISWETALVPGSLGWFRALRFAR